MAKSSKEKINKDLYLILDELKKNSHSSVNEIANNYVLEEWVLFGDPTLKIGGYT
jgi:hypothetical protein